MESGGKIKTDCANCQEKVDAVIVTRKDRCQYGRLTTVKQLIRICISTKL